MTELVFSVLQLVPGHKDFAAVGFPCPGTERGGRFFLPSKPFLTTYFLACASRFMWVVIAQ
jgi:hypothetical protein